MEFPLPDVKLEALGFDARQIARLQITVERHIAEHRYPGAQVALARNGALALYSSYGHKQTGEVGVAADDHTLWLLYSQTKILVAAAIWALAEAGELRYTDRVADLVPGFEVHGKGDITIFQILSHQGGFPNAEVTDAAWEDHEYLRHGDFVLEPVIEAARRETAPAVPARQAVVLDVRFASASFSRVVAARRLAWD